MRAPERRRPAQAGRKASLADGRPQPIERLRSPGPKSLHVTRPEPEMPKITVAVCGRPVEMSALPVSGQPGRNEPPASAAGTTVLRWPGRPRAGFSPALPGGAARYLTRGIQTVHKPSVTGSAADAGRVAIVEFSRGPANYLSGSLLGEIADRLDALAADGRTRAVVLCSTGRHFCAGAALAGSDDMNDPVRGAADIYAAGTRLIEQPLPVAVAVQGAAVGGGLAWPWPSTTGWPLPPPGSPRTSRASGCSRAPRAAIRGPVTEGRSARHDHRGARRAPGGVSPRRHPGTGAPRPAGRMPGWPGRPRPARHRDRRP